jgi:hypothetical protein
VDAINNVDDDDGKEIIATATTSHFRYQGEIVDMFLW